MRAYLHRFDSSGQSRGYARPLKSPGLRDTTNIGLTKENADSCFGAARPAHTAYSRSARAISRLGSQTVRSTTPRAAWPPVCTGPAPRETLLLTRGGSTEV